MITTHLEMTTYVKTLSSQYITSLFQCWPWAHIFPSLPLKMHALNITVNDIFLPGLHTHERF